MTISLPTLIIGGIAIAASWLLITWMAQFIRDLIRAILD